MAANFPSSPETPSVRQTPPVGGGGTKCQKENSCRAHARLKEFTPLSKTSKNSIIYGILKKGRNIE